MARLKFIAAVACEDIRQEDNGKLIIIGAFAADIQFATFPAIASLTFLVICEVPERTPVHSKFRLMVDDEQVMEGTATIVPSRPGRLLLRTPPVQVRIERPQSFVLQVVEATETGAPVGDWITLLQLPAELRPVPATV